MTSVEQTSLLSDKEVTELMQSLGERAQESRSFMLTATTKQRNTALDRMATAIKEGRSDILRANARDLALGREKGLSDPMLDRLMLNDARMEAIEKSIYSIIELDDPVGRCIDEWNPPSGLSIRTIRVPLGVVGVIYESRPNVTADAAALCIKSGNVAILRGGSESIYSSQAIGQCIHEGLRQASIPEDVVLLVPTTDRRAVGSMLRMVDTIDVIIPRGGKSLCERVQNESKIATLQHLEGNCHTYIHRSSDPDKAVRVVCNAKMRRVGICGATESLLVDDSLLGKTWLQTLCSTLLDQGCELRGDSAVQMIHKDIVSASDDDWSREYLAPILSIKTVSGVEDAVRWINHYGSHHTDSIIAEDDDAVKAFMRGVDSAIVMHNTSTQFADGGEFGMGAEIGIATGRLHARGPVGVQQMTTFTYHVTSPGLARS